MVELFFFLSLFSFPFFFCSFDILIDSLYISIWRTDLHTIERMSQHRHTNDDDDDGNVHIVCMMKCDRLTECTERSKRQKARPLLCVLDMTSHSYEPLVSALRSSCVNDKTKQTKNYE